LTPPSPSSSRCASTIQIVRPSTDSPDVPMVTD
jgi:hypothetical protein